MLFCIGVQLTNNVVVVSGVQQSDSVIHIYVYMSILFQVLFPYRLLQNIEYSSLGYTVGPCWLSIKYIVMCVCYSQTPNLPSLPTAFPFGNHKLVFHVFGSISVLYISLLVFFYF